MIGKILKRKTMVLTSLDKIIETTHSEETLKEAMRERKYILNKDFVFTNETLSRFLALNNELLQKMHDAYDKVQRIKLDLDQMIALGKVDYKDYWISGDVELKCSTNPLIDKLTYESRTYWTIHSNDFEAMPDRKEGLVLDTNWDYEMFHDKGLVKDSHYICFLMHTLFVDGHVLSLHDLTQLDDYEVVVNIDINI